MPAREWRKCWNCNGTGYHFLEHDGVCRYCKGSGGRYVTLPTPRFLYECEECGNEIEAVSSPTQCIACGAYRKMREIGKEKI